jgi:predicted nucleic acid-binding protein
MTLCTLYDMKAVKDAMVLIHFAKATILEKSCDYLQHVFIPEEVYKEVVLRDQEIFPDAVIVKELIKKKKITIKKIHDKNPLRRIHAFAIYRGEAEALALYQELAADLLVSDDNNLRKKAHYFDAKIVGSLGLLLKMRKDKKIVKEKFHFVLEQLRTIGWFSNAIIDKVIMEGEKYG